MTPIMAGPLAGTIQSDNYAALSSVSDLVIGLHNIFTFNGLVMNDLSQLEGYRLDEVTGFEDVDLRIADEDNVQEDGATPGPGYYGTRTMTFTGAIIAGTYPQWMRLRRALLDAFMDLVERPLLIQSKVGGFFSQPDVEIYCRKADKVLTPSRIEQKWMTSGIIDAPFTVILKATDPTYKATTVKQQSMVPGAVSFLGRSYDRAYDLAYNKQMDQFGNLTTVTNSMVINNAGNWHAMPTITLRGLQVGARLVNKANSHEIKIKHTIPTTDQIIIDTATGEITDALGVNRSDYLDTSSDWMRLVGTKEVANGANEVQLFLSNLDAQSLITFEWQDTYL